MKQSFLRNSPLTYVVVPTITASLKIILEPTMYVQSNFNGSNTFGTMKISSRQGQFEPVRVDESARSGGIIRISLIFYNMKVCCVFSLESPH